MISLLVLIIVMLFGILGANSFTPGKWQHSFRVQLGLDLSSGTQVTLNGKTLKGGAPSAQDMVQAKSIILARVNGAGFTGAQVQQQGSDDIVVTVPGKGSRQVENLIGTTALLFMRQVLLEGSATSVAPSSDTPVTPTTTTPTTPTPSTTPSSGATVQPTSTPSSGASGTSSPQAAGEPGMSGGHSLSHSSKLLAADQPEAASSASPKNSVSPSPSTTGSASPNPSGSASPGASPTPTPTPSNVNAAQGMPSLISKSVLKLFNKVNCNNKNWKTQIGSSQVYDNANQQIVSCEPAGNGLPTIKYVLDKAKVAGTDITGAQAALPNSQTSLSQKWQVNFSLNGRGSSAFGTLTADIASKYYANGGPTSVLDQVAVVLDGQVVSAPDIQEAIPGGNGQITYFPQSEAEQLANELSYGALPIKFTSPSIQSVSASLGHSQLEVGLIAAAVGLGLVIVYSFLYYRGLGLVSVSSLIVASALAYFSVVLLSKYASQGFSLSLASIAGLIVAIGITADSFVVFFERLRDEVREGRSLRPAVESGWKRARRTILVSDTVSFLAALLLWYFSISDVKGFAFTLGLTTLIDVIVVFLFTKPMVTLLARTRFFSSGRPMSGLDPTRLGARAPWRSGLPRTPRTPVKEA